MNTLSRHAIKVPSLVGGMFANTFLENSGKSGIAFLIYHSVSGCLPLELDVPYPLFRRQFEYLAKTKAVIAYNEALARLRGGNMPETPRYVLTFDDGYLNFYERVFPLLVEFEIPATLFLTTGFIEEGVAYPLLSLPNAQVQPVTWDMVGEMAESGLVELGAHTHTHPVLTGADPARVEEELVRPIELLRRRIGVSPRHFAYPRAMWQETVEPLIRTHYESAVIGGGRPAYPEGFDPYRIPRVPVRRSDGWWFFRAKLYGWLRHEEAVYGWLHRLRG